MTRILVALEMYSCNGLGLMDFTVTSLSHVGVTSFLRRHLPQVSPPPPGVTVPRGPGSHHQVSCWHARQNSPPEATCSNPAAQRQSRGQRALPNVASLGTWPA